MSAITITRRDILEEDEGARLGDVVGLPNYPLAAMMRFFDGATLGEIEKSQGQSSDLMFADIVRSFEQAPAIRAFARRLPAARAERFWESVGVVLRIALKKRTGGAAETESDSP